MSATTTVAGKLAELGYTNVFTTPPSVLVCCEPIVVAPGGWEREARLPDGGERGFEDVGVLVCCDDPRDAEGTCRACERELRAASWDGAVDSDGCRLVSIDSDGPRARGRDASGRWLWGFSLRCVVVRKIG